MPEVNIEIGGRVFQVACQKGEEHFLDSAAKLLDNEARLLAEQIGRMPETRMLLMAGLMLADKTAGLEEELRAHERTLQALNKELEAIQSSQDKPADNALPAQMANSLAEIAARTEALADNLETKVG